MIGLDRLHWKGNTLYFLTEEVMKVVQDEKEKTMWRVKYHDGILSKDYYNKSRARQHAENVYIRRWNRGDLNTQQSLTGARG